MPYKYLQEKGVAVKKQKYRVSNWSEYNASLKQRGDIEIWLSQEITDNWYASDRIYDGTGTPDLYSDAAIIVCHELRKVLRLPLRQTQGFVDSIFRIQELEIKCPDFGTLSKRLERLGLETPRYKKHEKPDDDLAAIAIDSTGLKRFGRDEWHQEKHKVSAKRSWRKLHIAVDGGHYIVGSALTDRFVNDSQEVEGLLGQIDEPIEHFTADGAYDENAVYEEVLEHSPAAADVVIQPDKNAVYSDKNNEQRNKNILEIMLFGRMMWQRLRKYGKRNYSELAIQRYKRILGNTLQAREFVRQKQETIIGCGVLNKMTSLGMPESYRVA
jgi:hypothetical protein